jgi:hypothetical protein
VAFPSRRLGCKERRGAPSTQRAPATTPYPAFLRLPRNRRASGVVRYPRIAESKSSVLSINAIFTWRSPLGSSATVSDHPQRGGDIARGMSRENVEIVRTAMDAFNRRVPRPSRLTSLRMRRSCRCERHWREPSVAGPTLPRSTARPSTRVGTASGGRSRWSETVATGFPPWDGFVVAELTVGHRLSERGGTVASDHRP